MGLRDQDIQIGLDWSRGAVFMRATLSQALPADHRFSPPLGWRDLLHLRQQGQTLRHGRRRIGWAHPRPAVRAWLRTLSAEEYDYLLAATLARTRLGWLGLLWDALWYPPPAHDGDGVPEAQHGGVRARTTRQPGSGLLQRGG